MEWLKKNHKTVIGGLVILILLEMTISWYLIHQFRDNYLSGNEALAIAAEDANLEQAEIRDTDIDLHTGKGKAWYDIEITVSGQTFLYQIDAETGDILSVSEKKNE